MHGGPTISHMRGMLVDPVLLQDALDPDFTIAYPTGAQGGVGDTNRILPHPLHGAHGLLYTR